MITFISAFLMLIMGYMLYGKLVERAFGADRRRPTPCYTHQDGVDYMPMPTWKVFLIQFLNIAGTGPIFGAVQGILFGPAAYFWIVLGCIFGGAVHDYSMGMLSLRRNGASMPEIIGDELGVHARHIVRILSMCVVIMVGAVFTTTPADLLDSMTTDVGFLFGRNFWIVVIVLYYLLATLMPIDKIIGRIYPVFGMALLIMACGVLGGIFFVDGGMPEITEAFSNHHPNPTMPIFPGICITIACGAVSGFHATQSPMMARCLKNERLGRHVFYGAMITEGLVALIWAAGAIKFADSLDVPGDTPYAKLLNAMTTPSGGISPALVVNSVCQSWLGTVGSILAILGVVAAPLTSGDTALRSARLIMADYLSFSQKKIKNRLAIAIPLFAVSVSLLYIDFSILWRYFAWLNQMLATITLWAISVWFVRHAKRHKFKGVKSLGYLMALLPAMWMTMVVVSYICGAPEGFDMKARIAYIVAGTVTVAITAAFFCYRYRYLSKEK